MGRYNCKECGKTFETNNGRIRYCKDCYIKILKDNIDGIKHNSFYLIPSNFNCLSDIKSRGYIKYIKSNIFNNRKTNWMEICRYYNLEEELIKQFKKLFLIWSKENNSQSVNIFLKENNLDIKTYSEMIDWKRIKEELKMKEVFKNITDSELILNFKEVVEQCGYIPFPTTKFYNMSKFSSGLFQKRFGKYSNKFGSIYDYLISYIDDDSLVNQYFVYKENYMDKINNEKTGMIKKYTFDQLESNLIEVFEGFYSEYNIYPSVCNFDSISKIDNSVYRNYYKKSWKKIVQDFGYNYDLNHFNKSEKIFLKTLDKVLNSKHEPQKTWNWLKYKSNLFCDGYYKDYNLACEFMGIQHRTPVEIFGGEKSFELTVKRDVRKSELLSEHNIKLLTIWFDEDWRNPEFLKEKLKELGIGQ